MNCIDKSLDFLTVAQLQSEIKAEYEKRMIKIEFDEFNFNENEGIDTLLRVSSKSNETSFSTLSSFAYKNEENDFNSNEDVVEKCMIIFAKTLKNNNVEFDNDDFG